MKLSKPDKARQLLLEFVAALEALPTKELIRGRLIDESGKVCAAGSLLKFRGLTLDSHTFYRDQLRTRGIQEFILERIMRTNDAIPSLRSVETTRARWQRMHNWATEQLRG